jgi:tol-pal system protein YbgF
MTLMKTLLRNLVGTFALLAVLALAWPASAQDAAEAVVRLNRMENQMRQMSGQIEQLQFENRRLTEQLKRFQEDTEFRLSGQKGSPTGATPQGQPRKKQSDAFDPAAQPGSAAAPRNLAGGGVPAGGGIGAIIENEDGPLDLSGVARPVPGAPLNRDPSQRTGPSIAATGSASPRETYDAAYAYVLRKEYQQAEMGFRQFLQSNPRDRLSPDATFWLGESYYQRGRHREAAEQFLKVSTDYPRAGKAPDSLLKLGMSLNALGARDQACVTYAKLERDYPQASTGVRQGLEREQKRARCTA